MGEAAGLFFIDVLWNVSKKARPHQQVIKKMSGKFIKIIAICCILIAGSANSYAQDESPENAFLDALRDVQNAQSTDAQADASGDALPEIGTVSEERKDVYREYKQAAERYKHEITNYRIDLRRALMTEYQTRLSSVDTAYDEKIQKLRTEEASMRADVIRRMEDFIEKYGDTHPKSADVLYRLARLYYEKSDDEFLSDDSGTIDHPDFSKTLELVARLERNFPDYYQMDGARI